MASHLIAGLLRDAGFKLTIVHGTKEPIRLNGVRYVYSSLLSVRISIGFGSTVQYWLGNIGFVSLSTVLMLCIFLGTAIP